MRYYTGTTKKIVHTCAAGQAYVIGPIQLVELRWDYFLVEGPSFAKLGAA